MYRNKISEHLRSHWHAVATSSVLQKSPPIVNGDPSSISHWLTSCLLSAHQFIFHSCVRKEQHREDNQNSPQSCCCVQRGDSGWKCVFCYTTKKNGGKIVIEMLLRNTYRTRAQNKNVWKSSCQFSDQIIWLPSTLPLDFLPFVPLHQTVPSLGEWWVCLCSSDSKTSFGGLKAGDTLGRIASLLGIW